jgi:hypothetical protein
MAVRPARRPFTVDEYHRMAEAGILTHDDRVELLDGEIVEMTPASSPHASCVYRLTRLLMFGVGDRAVVRGQSPLILDDLSEPEPDGCVARARDDNYPASHPRPDYVLLVSWIPPRSSAAWLNLPIAQRHLHSNDVGSDRYDSHDTSREARGTGPTTARQPAER